MKPQAHLDAIRLRLITSPVVTEVVVVRTQDFGDKGYFRARLVLANGDFLEVAEFFVIDAGDPVTVEYRFQWMDSARQDLRKRWDNAAHYPNLPGAPHHVHVGDETTVEPGKPITLLDLINLLEQTIDL